MDAETLDLKVKDILAAFARGERSMSQTRASLFEMAHRFGPRPTRLLGRAELLLAEAAYGHRSTADVLSQIRTLLKEPMLLGAKQEFSTSHIRTVLGETGYDLQAGDVVKFKVYYGARDLEPTVWNSPTRSSVITQTVPAGK